MKSFTYTFIVLSTFLFANLVEARIVDRIAAIVDGEVITESEILTRAAPLLAQVDLDYPDLGENRAKKQEIIKATLQELIDEKLLLEAAKELQFTVTAEEIDRGVQRILALNGLTSLDQLETELKTTGSSLKLFREEVRRQLLRYKVVDARRTGRVNVTDEEALATCEADQKEADATIGGVEVDLQQISLLLPATATPEELEEKKKQAQLVLSRIESGEEFAKIAEELSDDPRLELGTIELSSLDTSLADVIRVVPKGKTTKAIEIPGLILILKVVDKREIQTSCQTQLTTYREALEQRETSKIMRSYLAELRKKSYVDIKL